MATDTEFDMGTVAECTAPFVRQHPDDPEYIWRVQLPELRMDLYSMGRMVELLHDCGLAGIFAGQIEAAIEIARTEGRMSSV